MAEKTVYTKADLIVELSKNITDATVKAALVAQLNESL